jgi:hypothetical protein
MSDETDDTAVRLPEALPEQMPEQLPEDAPVLLDPDEDLDVTAPGPDGEPIHHSVGGDVGEGAD